LIYQGRQDNLATVNNYRELLGAFLKRLVPAMVLGGFGWWLLATADGGWAAFPRLLFGMASMVAFAILLASPIAGLFAEPSGSIFYPGRRLSRPLPMYSIPESKRARGDYEEAMTGFEAIAADYPDELKPYIAMIEIAIENLKDADRANAIFQRGIELLKDADDKDTLARMYRATRSRLNARP
jgi:tetratricopeptide (TPR) repeat protein